MMLTLTPALSQRERVWRIAHIMMVVVDENGCRAPAGLRAFCLRRRSDNRPYFRQNV
jgi:hypothetical protein